MLHFSKFIYLLFLLFGYCMTHSDEKHNNLIENIHKCKCVIYYLCSANNTIITNGEGLLSPRINDPNRIICKGSQHNQILVCCKLIDNTSVYKNPTRVTPYNITNNPITTPRKKTCGQQLTLVAPKIMSTVEDFTIKGEFPWTAIIYVKNTANEWIFCGTGALISPRAILTAHHLCQNFRESPNHFKVVMTGDAVRHKVVEYSENQRNVIEIIKHPTFYSGTLIYDAAMLILDREFSSDVVNTICLPPDYTNENSGRCLVSGWGTAPEFQGVVMLKKIRVPLVPFDKCQASLRKTILGQYFQLNMCFICAGGEDGMDACLGDGGSPLMCPMPNGNGYYHAGIVSWGVHCGNKGIPGVYMSTRKIKGWITDELSRRNLAF
ncbi:unnamed protein product [Phyllotreta striolata]|uniref:Peptidase S1 domain-containing protein n=1 Tax=Phyllotreta striolata TaxID=444603 RepID=A0A9N9TN57_PHYSR|nr:unnamed protein product [Phyllotreta striolata]